MKLSVFGLGYVGTVSAACFAMRGHRVIGVDSNPAKTGLINQRQAPIVEKDVGGIVARAAETGTLRATTDAREAVLDSDISIICVGTPALSSGRLDTRAVEKVSHEIGAAIAQKSTPHTVVVRSTMLPGTFRGLVLPALASSSGKRAGEGFTVAVNPEFLREGSAVSDFLHPEKTVIGCDDEDTGDVVASLYEGLPGEFVRTTPELAQFTKYVDNSWHAVKVSFANEIGNLCKALGIDSHAAMRMMTMDTKLNISPAYLKPGFAFGGSCLPKDTRALTYFARTLDLNVPLLQSIIPSNAHQIDRACDWVLSYGKKRIALLGCSFKADTDDMRESPFILLTERLLGKGCSIRIYDKNVNVSMLMGANRDYVTDVIPHIASLFVDSMEDAVRDADVVLMTAFSPDYLDAPELMEPEQILLDFAYVPQMREHAGYDGVNW
ncbi:MAG TPA: UDP-glucose/GDP-mannose dehydrogenase family protein [Rhizomicrobium sp.]|jgi:GDP-mannose 6-dehydrogenase